MERILVGFTSEYYLNQGLLKPLNLVANMNYELLCGSYISSNADEIAVNQTDIGSNANNIITNAVAIINNHNHIATNTSNIATNTSNITTNRNNINNLGEGVAGATALTAALSSLPEESENSQSSCGLGSGFYSSRTALAVGCASNINNKVSVNGGVSYVFDGSRDYGSGELDNVAAKAGFVFRFGDSPTVVASKTTQALTASSALPAAKHLKSCPKCQSNDAEARTPRNPRRAQGRHRSASPQGLLKASIKKAPGQGRRRRRV